MATTAVLSILSETTTPSRTLRLLRFSLAAPGATSVTPPGAASVTPPGAASVAAPGAASVAAPGTASVAASVAVSVSSAISALPLGRFDLPQAQEGVDPRDLAAHLTQARGVVQLPGDVLEAQVEVLLLGLGQLAEQAVDVQLAQLFRLLVGH